MTNPRIIAGAFKGKKLSTPPGLATRPTSGRARQAAFDILLHAPWAGAAFMQKARVLDVFAGTGAFGLEALSRGAAAATFIEISRDAQAVIKANILACKVAHITRVMGADALAPPPGHAHELVFFDPPYGQNLTLRALLALSLTGWVAPGAIIVAELGPDDELAPAELLAERVHGKARLLFWRAKP
ncbi:MAG: 16S rRNA (guanine(966)-N(2))-methyltransferase RsmD [Acidocella sp.]|nr:16S rRNA (guanine(966)-N(2))-methyltransferase RsmD [Acidocella sp.]